MHSFLYSMMPFRYIIFTPGHWVTSSCIGQTVAVYDSNCTGNLNAGLSEQLASMYRLAVEDEEDEETVLMVHVPYVQQQIGGKDCGVFAVAFALHLSLGQELADIRFDQSRMRQRLLRCFQKRKLEGFPQQQKTGVTLKSRLRIREIALYCTCRMPDTGRHGSV